MSTKSKLDKREEPPSISVDVCLSDPEQFTALLNDLSHANDQLGIDARIVIVGQDVRRGAIDTSFVVTIAAQILTSSGASVLSYYICDKLKEKKSRVDIKGNRIVQPSEQELTRILREMTK